MSVWNRLRILKIFIQLIRNPNRTDLVFKGIQIASREPKQKALQAVENLVLSNLEFKKMYDSDYMPKPPALSELAKLSENSFGYAVYQHMKQNNLDFKVFPCLNSRRPIEYLSARIYQDHDLWHVLLNCGISVEDELSIKAMGVAQFQSPIGTLIIAGGLLHLLSRDPSRAVQALNRINEVYSIGTKSRFLLSIRLHDFFAYPLQEVKEICGVA